MYNSPEELRYILMGGNVIRRKLPDYDVFGKVVIKDWAYIRAHA